MKKILLFLIPILLLLPLTVKANTNSFYEAEYINDIYMNKVKDNTIYYQKARFFRQKNTNNPVYCIEPFATFNENSIYEPTSYIKNLNPIQKDRISLLSYYGYNYQNHTDEKWYAITQFLIWKEADPTANYYFTDSLNGNKISIFENEINELYNLINNHNTTPSFQNSTFYMPYNNSIAINDRNNVLKNFTVKNQDAIISNNTISFSNLDVGTHKIVLEKKQFHNQQQTFYQSNTSQDLVTIGNIKPITTTINIIVQKTNVELKKIDKDTNSTTPSGDASLQGTTFELYNSINQKIKDIVIDKDIINIENLNYGDYYIKEKNPGTGYKLNNNIYNFKITSTEPIVKLEIENDVIKKKIIIKKLYGTENNFKPEKNISFNIYHNNNFLTTIKTNESGEASIILPYGNYTIKQLTTTEGYQKVEPIQITVDNEDEQTIILKNYKINVPNTSTKNSNYNIIKLFLKLICQKLNYILY